MINSVTLIGNLGQDIELKYTQAGTAVATLSVATSRTWKDKENNRQGETEWHRVIVWAQTAEFCGNYLSKGNKVYVQGRLQTRKWQDQNGNDRYTTEIVANELKSLTPKGESEGGSDSSYSAPDGGSNSSSTPGNASNDSTPPPKNEDVPF